MKRNEMENVKRKKSTRDVVDEGLFARPFRLSLEHIDSYKKASSKALSDSPTVFPKGPNPPPS